MAESYSTPADNALQEAAPSSVILLLRWLVVGLPLAWGIIETLKKSLAMFQ